MVSASFSTVLHILWDNNAVLHEVYVLYNFDISRLLKKTIVILMEEKSPWFSAIMNNSLYWFASVGLHYL